MAITSGPLLNSVPAPLQQALVSNYIDFTAPGTSGWAQQYLPDLCLQTKLFGQNKVDYIYHTSRQ